MKTALSSIEKSSTAQLNAKDEHIKFLQKEYDFLNIMTPEVIRKRFANANQALSVTITEMDAEVVDLKSELKEKSDKIENLKIAGEEFSDKEDLLNTQIIELEDKLKSTESELKVLKSASLSKPEIEKFDNFIGATGSFALPPDYSILLSSAKDVQCRYIENLRKMSDTFDKYKVVYEPNFKYAKGGDSIEESDSSDDSDDK